jgi:hypothetical protein
VKLRVLIDLAEPFRMDVKAYDDATGEEVDLVALAIDFPGQQMLARLLESEPGPGIGHRSTREVTYATPGFHYP